MKICPQCNAEVSDDAKFCNVCGKTLSADSTPASNNAPEADKQAAAPKSDFGDNTIPPMNPPQAEAVPADGAPQKKNNLPIIIGAAAGGFAVLLILVIVIISSLGAYKKPINKLVSLANSKSTNVSSYLDAVTPSYVSKAYNDALGLLKKGDAKTELQDAIDDAFSDVFDEFEDDYGKNWKIKAEFRKAKKLSKKKIEDLQDNWDSLKKTLKDLDMDDEDFWENISDTLDDEYDTEIDTAKAAKIAEALLDGIGDTEIKAAYEVKVKLTIKGKEDEDDNDLVVNVVKINGKWIIDPLSMDSIGGVSASSLLNELRYLEY
ncbi:MAG: zinc ribbon domain-containing protein [Lachnospiraceae bacterium]|nr:zinc ribbon domain-containing protein [Lachnospiraceae bacterium]